MKVSVILLTWQRLNALPTTLQSLSNQTYKDFDLYISNGNLDRHHVVERYCGPFKDKLNMHLSHDGNDDFSFRRITIAQKLANQGTDVILFIDDDVGIPQDYIEKCLLQYEPKTYKSAYAWYFTNKISYYSSRIRVFDENSPVHYAGTGLAMVDAKIFLEEGLTQAPPCAQRIEDLWLSYYASHVLGWKLGWIKDSGAEVFGRDRFALNRQVKNSDCNKDDFFSDLTLNRGWDISI